MSKKNTYTIFLTLALAFFAGAFAFSAGAQTDFTGLSTLGQSGLSAQDPRVTIANIIRIALGFLGIIAVVIILYAGFLYLTSGGSEEKVSTAKNLLRNGIIGLVIVLSAFGIASFVISRLSSATNTPGAASLLPSGTGGGGGGVGGGAVLSGGQFAVAGVSPVGQTSIRNLTVKVTFSRPVDTASLRDNIVISKTSDGSAVSGNFVYGQTKVEFIPGSFCPTPDETKRCFDANTEYGVEVKSGSSGVKSATGDLLSCGLAGGLCKTFFISGDEIDRSGPSVSFVAPQNGSSVAVNDMVLLQAHARDEGGVSHVEFYLDAAADESTLLGSSSPLYSTSPSEFLASISWDTNNIAAGKNHTLIAKAYDLDSNASQTSIEVNFRAAHCFDGQKNTDETDIDCGGVECGKCNGASCVQDKECKSNACINGFCSRLPVITNVNPYNGAPNNLITIDGTNFSEQVGQVTFLGEVSDTSDDVLGLAPLCGNVWSDSEIVIKVPSQARSGPIQVRTQSGLLDHTDNDIGIRVSFDINSEIRPGLCRLTPDSGEVGGLIMVAGENLGNQAQSLLIGSMKASGIGTWTENAITDAVIPSISAGKAPVFVEVNGRVSNSVSLDVSESRTVPKLEFSDPIFGPVSQMITLYGKNFGLTAGQVRFIAPDGSELIADTSFPLLCEKNFWHDDLITVKVPNTEIGKYKIVVVNGQNKISNSIDFTVNNAAKTPGICALLPDNGPAGIAVTIAGEGFGDIANLVRFFPNLENGTITQWTDTEINVQTPPNVGSGPVKVISKNGTLSNGVTFKVGKCSTASCQEGYQCCGSGACQIAGSCAITEAACRYTWGVSTGNLSLLDESKFLRVLEDASCTVVPQSPSPYKDSENACINADIVVRMNKNLLDQSLDSGNVRLQKCGAAAIFDASDCDETPLVCAMEIINHDTSEEGFRLRAIAPLEANTWYQVVLKKSSVINGVNQLDGFVSDEGYSFKNDYVWHFKTDASGAACDFNKVLVMPSDATLHVKEQTQDYIAGGFAANCNLVSPGTCNASYAWAWSSSDMSKATVLSQTDKATATAKAETFPDQPVVISATETNQNISGQGKLFINFTDPEVEAFWPNCSLACINAEIGARFSIAMNPETLTSQNIRLYACVDQNCLANLEPMDIENIVYDDNRRALSFLPSLAGSLQPSHWYRAVINGGVSGVKSVSNGKLVGLNFPQVNPTGYSWIFGTKGDANLCQIASVSVSPEEKDMYLIGLREKYYTSAFGSPDSCNPQGQRLNAFSYDWSWMSSNEGVATVTSEDLIFLDGKEDPLQLAQSVGVGATPVQSGGDVVGTTTINANTLGKSGQGTLRVHCGFQSDASCPAPATPDTYGVGADTCCYARPAVTEVIPAGTNVCRNAVMKLRFNGDMDYDSVLANVKLQKNFGDNACPQVSDAGFFERLWNYFRGMFGKETQAQSIENWCDIGQTVLASKQGNDYFAEILIDEVLDSNAVYRIHVVGDQNIFDNVQTGVKNGMGVVMRGDFTSLFTTGAEICDIENVTVRVLPQDKVTLEDLLSCARNDCEGDQSDTIPSNQHRYIAEAYDKNNIPVRSSFEWSRSGANVTNLLKTDERGACVSGESASQTGQAVCVSASPTNGEDKITVRAQSLFNASSMSRTLKTKVFLCENPWPSLHDYPYTDPETNMSFFFCRDAGQPGFDDDLPALNFPVKNEGIDPGVFREFFFFVQ